MILTLPLFINYLIHSELLLQIIAIQVIFIFQYLCFNKGYWYTWLQFKLIISVKHFF